MITTQIVIDKLNKLGLTLPNPSKPGGAYEAVNIVGNIAYIAIQLTKLNDEFLYIGRLGNEISTEDGIKAAELCALNVLSQINKHITFEKVKSLNHIDAYYQSTDDWEEAPKVIDGASKLFLNTLGENGKHSRAIFGVHKLPKKMAIGITVSLTLKNNEN